MLFSHWQKLLASLTTKLTNQSAKWLTIEYHQLLMSLLVQVINKPMLFEEGVPVNGRMDIELDDYPGSGANSRHDPKNPVKP